MLLRGSQTVDVSASPVLSLQPATTSTAGTLVRLLVRRGRWVVNIGGRRTTPASEEDAADNILKDREWIMHVQHFSDDVKVDEKQHDTEVDERERRWNEEDSTHLKNEDNWCNQARLQLTVNNNNYTHTHTHQLCHRKH